MQAWLIERTDVLLCLAHDGACIRWVTFNDPMAWRFASRFEAEEIVTRRKLKDVRVLDHSWT
jgi:hypothetical protein